MAQETDHTVVDRAIEVAVEEDDRIDLTQMGTQNGEALIMDALR